MTSTAVYLYLDVETAPTHDYALIDELFEKHRIAPLDLSTITAAANLKDPEKIALDVANRTAKAITDHEAAMDKAGADYREEVRKMCLDATTGHLACISAALGDAEVGHGENLAFRRYADEDLDTDLVPLEDVLDGERDMLENFFTAVEAMLNEHARGRAEAEWAAHEPRQIKDGHWQLMIPGTGQKYSRFVAGEKAFIKEALRLHRQAPVVVAHHAQFDIRYIWQRCVILGVQVPSWWPIDARPWDNEKVQDTMTAWAGHGNRIGLDRLCKALGIPGKPDDIDGSKVWDAIRDGRIADVAAYCDGDVERLRAVHRRIRGVTVETTTTEFWTNRKGRAEIVDTLVEGAV